MTNESIIAALAACAEHELAPGLATGAGKYLGSIDPRLTNEALLFSHRYARTQPKVVLDLAASRCIAVTFKIGAGERELAELETKHGTFGVLFRELAEFALDGTTQVARNARETRLARLPVGARLQSVILGGLSIATSGYATLPTVMPIAELNEAWIAFIADVPRVQAARAQAEREEAELWRRGQHPSQRPNPASRRLLESCKIQHGGSLLDLTAGAVIDDPQLLGALEHAGALIGSLDDMPQARNLQPGEARFRGAFRAAMGVGGYRAYREGHMLTNVTKSDVDELRHAGAVLDFGGPIMESHPEFYNGSKPPRGGSRKAA